MFYVLIREFVYNDELEETMWTTKTTDYYRRKDDAEAFFAKAVKTVISRYREGEYLVEKVNDQWINIHYGWSSDPEYYEFDDVDEVVVIRLMEES